MKLKTKNGCKYLFLFLALACLRLEAQRHSFYYGKSRLAGISLAAPLGEIKLGNTVKTTPLGLQFRIEQMHGRIFLSGFHFQSTSLPFKDEFSNNGFDNDYFVKVGPDQKKVNNGSGNCVVNNIEFHLMTKVFFGQRSMRPMGTYFGLGAGLSFSSCLIKKDYDLWYSQYYDNSIHLNYSLNSDQKIRFIRPYFLAELGYSLPVSGKRLLLNFAIQARTYVNRPINDAASLSDRFRKLSRSLVSEYQAFNLLAGISYAF